MKGLKISDVTQAFDKGRKKGRKEGYNQALKDLKKKTIRKDYVLDGMQK